MGEEIKNDVKYRVPFMENKTTFVYFYKFERKKRIKNELFCCFLMGIFLVDNENDF